MNSRKLIAAFLVGTVLMGFASSRALADRSLLVIPARYAVVQFSWDVTHLRHADLVVYDTRGEKGDLVIHFWDTQRNAWTKINLDELRLGTMFDETPSRVFVVGADRDVPPAVVAAVTALSGQQVRVPSLRVVDMVNTLNESLKFSAGEWKWLAKRHGLETVDLNANRRRYGRYGGPGSKTEGTAIPDATAPALPMPKGTVDEMAPAPIAVPTPAPVVEKPDQPAPKATPAAEVRQPAPAEKQRPEDK